MMHLALRVLEAPDPADKIVAARAAADLTFEDLVSTGATLPDRPARPARPLLAHPNDVPRRRLGSEHGRIALLHALAHIEFNAIDLAFDMAARFAAECEARLGAAEEFVTDWISVGIEEAEHFELLQRRLTDLGSFYGAHPAHDGLWEAAFDTRENWAARLAVVPMVLEARGLDITPATVKKLHAQGDTKSAEILDKIYFDEIRHVGIGVKWFSRLCEADCVKPDEAFKSLVPVFFKGRVKPPFNEEARAHAGLLPIFYR